jgi:hypothetical protein
MDRSERLVSAFGTVPSEVFFPVFEARGIATSWCDPIGAYRFVAARFRLPEDLRGTLAPFFRASLRPIAIACLRLVTFLPEPLLSVPFFRRRIVDFTFFDADLPYFAIAPP